MTTQTKAEKTILRIMLVDDHQIMREGLAELVEREGQFRVVAQAASAAEALQSLRETPVDLALIDYSLPDINGVDLIRCIHQRNRDLPTLIVSMHEEPVFAQRALDAGARGYISKDDSIAHLVDAIQTVVSGGVHLSPRMSALLDQYNGFRQPD